MTDRYAVFGNPINHSLSPDIHTRFAQQTGEDIVYMKQQVEIGQFSAEAKKFFESGGNGLNITVPFKLDAYAFASVLSERAELAGAVNTLKKMPDGKIYGDNTDGIGLVRDITQNLGWEIKGKHVLILGAGGAVRGVMGPLLAEQPNSITIVNRTKKKAGELKNIFSIQRPPIYTWAPDSEPPAAMPIHGYDFVINGTPAGLLDDDESWSLSLWFQYVKLAPDCHAYDMVYGKTDSPFLSVTKHKGVGESNISDGLGMLVEQAAESFFIWRGVRPDTAPVIKEVRRQL